MTGRPRGRHIVYAVTSASTADVLLRGQLVRLRADGYRITLVVNPSSGLPELAERDGIDVVPVPMTREPSVRKDLVSLVRILRVLRGLRPAVLNYSTPKAALLAGVAGWLLRVPHRVYVVRGLRLEGAHGARQRLLHALESLTLRTATEVWFVSQSLQARAEQLGLLGVGRGRVLGSGSSNGVDVERFRPGPSVVTGLWGDTEPTGPVVGFVGRLTSDKGVGELWAAMEIVRASVPGTALLLVGDFENGDAVPAEAVRAIRADPLTVVTGWTGRTAELYRSMDVLALPTYREGFPNVVLEASATGLPVVTTTATGASDSVVPGVTGLLVPPGDAAALAGALLTVLGDRDRAAVMGRSGRARVIADYRREDVWDRVGLEYARMTEEGPRPVASRDRVVSANRHDAPVHQPLVAADPGGWPDQLTERATT